LAERFPGGEGEIQDAEVRNYLASRVTAAAQEYERSGRGLLPVNGQSCVVHRMPYQANGPLGLGSLTPALDLTSPPRLCPDVGTIWSQPGNSFTRIVDLSDPDNPRALLPPGNSRRIRRARITRIRWISV
jgi:hypothetical protein